MTNRLIKLPGLIDCHVHFREPGFEHKGTMESESSAAKAGGILTVCDMPNTNPPTVSVEAFKKKVEMAGRVKDADIRLFFGIADHGHIEEFKILMGNTAEIRGSTKLTTSESPLRNRCPGAKVFFDHSTGDMGAEKDTIEGAFRVCSELKVPLVAHCEDAQLNKQAAPGRPPESEVKAIEDAIGFAKIYGTHLHIAHVSTGNGVELVRQAKKSGLHVTCEAAPHHLFLTTDDYKALGALAKMNPPLRMKEDQEMLWEGIADGTVDCIASDHAPHTLEEKNAGNPLNAPSGVSGVETMLPLLLTVASGSWPHPKDDFQLSTFNFQLEDIRRLCFENPNKIFSLGASDKPRVTVDTSIEWTIKGLNLHYKCKWTPYEDWRVIGRVVDADGLSAVVRRRRTQAERRMRDGRLGGRS